MNKGMIKYIENLAVNKFFEVANEAIVKNDVLDYVNNLKLKASPYEKMHASLNAIERLEGSYSVQYIKEQFSNFREMSHFYFS